MKEDKNTSLNLSQHTDDVGMRLGFKESIFLSPQHFNEAIFLQIFPLRYIRRVSWADLFRSVEISGLTDWMKYTYIVCSVLSWWCNGWLCPWTLPNVPIYSWFAPYLVTTARYPPPGTQMCRALVNVSRLISGIRLSSVCQTMLRMSPAYFLIVSSYSECLLYKY